jgi:hypothetical protein
MSSNINPYNIDGTFPVAGQDNPSQGFRDNFTNIKNNFIFAQTELNDLQSKAITTSALTGQNINNDMAGTPIIRPQLSVLLQYLILTQATFKSLLHLLLLVYHLLIGQRQWVKVHWDMG